HDALWPNELWPAMTFEGPLRLGAQGGHGPIRYRVAEIAPGRRIAFAFTAPLGFEGFHAFEIEPLSADEALLRHRLEMNSTGLALLSWPLLFRPLHDALIEDALTKAEASLGVAGRVRPWPRQVIFLRWLLSRGKARKRSPNSFA
ncbi:MAG TPA: hypothetical protein VEH76_00690, partial [Methylocystis sp.]|nr:hypothetical protein [Methylocystis sp.]